MACYGQEVKLSLKTVPKAEISSRQNSAQSPKMRPLKKKSCRTKACTPIAAGIEVTPTVTMNVSLFTAPFLFRSCRLLMELPHNR